IGGGHEKSFDLGEQVAVHARHLELVLEIGYGTQAPDNNAAILLAYKILEQAGEAFDFNVGVMAKHFLGNFDTLIDSEERLFGMAVGDSHDDMVKQAGCATHQVFVATCKGVECSGIDCSNHANSEF